MREEDQIDGLTKLLMIALRALTLIEIVVRGRLAENQETSRPTATRLLQAIARMESTLTRMESSAGGSWWLTPLPPLVERILALLSLPRELYTGLAINTG